MKDSESGSVEVGYIAQDLQDVVPELVSSLPPTLVPASNTSDGTSDAGEDVYYGVRYGRVCALATEAVKELHNLHSAEISAIKEEMKTKETKANNRITSLETQLKAMQEQMQILMNALNKAHVV
jgi:hypothetical protein